MAKEQNEFPMEGPGVAPVKDKKLEQLADKMTSLQEERAGISEKITQADVQAVERMKELGIKKYKFRDREIEIKPGKDHAIVREAKPAKGSETDIVDD